MRFLNFTIIKLTIFLIVGILIGYYFSPSIYTSLVCVVISIVVMLLVYVIQKKQFKQSFWFGVLVCLTTIQCGILTINVNNQTNFSNHYSHFISDTYNTAYSIKFRVNDVLKPSKFSNKYIVDIITIDSTQVIGKLLLNIKKDSNLQVLSVDDTFFVKTNFKSINSPLNPGQFDYKHYLKKKYIYHQLFINTFDLIALNSNKTTLFGIANNVRAFINSRLKSYSFKPKELAIINALFLGQRQDISKEIYTAYTNAGAVHILAVSGLHIGIILLILNFVFKPIERLKYGKLIKACILVFLLWSFAIIAGLSASVTRAVTMFSIITVSLNINRPTNIFNTLAISMFLILVVKPMFLFDIGFQLSYVAVFAIVCIDPLLYKVWQPKKWLLDKYWHTLTVTLSAQFGIIPLSLFYFHQFPGLFFLSNLIIIPLLGFILGFGILIIILAVMGFLPSFLAQCFGVIISSMNNVVSWISQQDAFLFQDISFSIFYVFTSYLLIITIIKFLYKPKFKNSIQVLLACIILQLVAIGSSIYKPNNALVIFHKSKFSIIGKVVNNTLTVFHNLKTPAINNRIIKDYKTKHNLNYVEEHKLLPLYELHNTRLIVIDSFGIYNVENHQPDYVLLQDSPKINLNRLIDSIQPKHIIADGSNYSSYVDRWAATCFKRKLPFYQTSKIGAFIIKN